MTALQTIAVAFAMFSALPMPQFDWNEKNMRYALCAFPLVGAVCGALWCVFGVLPLPAAARAAGHKNINMDLIAGLPGDTVEGFEASLRQAIALDPENITVHTLTLKRASNIVVEHRAADYADVAAMLGKCSLLADAGYRPYYMYRQKGTLQNLENIGWAKPGFECLYNIYIMEEVHTILSAGAGGSTKLVIPGQRRGKIERIFNFKYPTEYIDRFAELLDRKKAVEDFYARYTSQTLRQP